jgi:hypothetical protein
MNHINGLEPTPPEIPVWQLLDVADGLSRARLEMAAGVSGDRLAAELRDLRRRISILVTTLGRTESKLGSRMIKVYDTPNDADLWLRFGDESPDCPCCEDDADPGG